MIFVDTGAWIALALANDRHAREARRVQESIARGERGSIVTTNFVLDEAATHIRMEGDATAAARFVRSLLESESVTVVWIDLATFRAALDVLERNADKRWSLTDCTSFAVMRELGVAHAFSFDHSLEEAGFLRVP